MPLNNGSGSYLMILSMKQQPRMAFIATVLESTGQWLMTSIPKNNAGFHQYHTVLVLGTFYLCVKHCPWQLRNSQPQTLGAHFLGTHSAHYPRFVEETIIAGWVCEEGGCLSYWEQEAEWRNTQGEIRPCRPSPCVPVLPPFTNTRWWIRDASRLCYFPFVCVPASLGPCSSTSINARERDVNRR